MVEKNNRNAKEHMNNDEMQNTITIFVLSLACVLMFMPPQGSSYSCAGCPMHCAHVTHYYVTIIDASSWPLILYTLSRIYVSFYTFF